VQSQHGPTKPSAHPRSPPEQQDSRGLGHGLDRLMCFNRSASPTSACFSSTSPRVPRRSAACMALISARETSPTSASAWTNRDLAQLVHGQQYSPRTATLPAVIAALSIAFNSGIPAATSTPVVRVK